MFGRITVNDNWRKRYNKELTQLFGMVMLTERTVKEEEEKRRKKRTRRRKRRRRTRRRSSAAPAFHSLLTCPYNTVIFIGAFATRNCKCHSTCIKCFETVRM
jgi:hypothetical protein